MKILVLGSEGQLGSCLIKTLLQNKKEVFGLNKSTADITDYKSIEQEINSKKPNIIVNATAYTAVELAESNADAANAVNNIGVRHLAKLARINNALLIHISTDYVFDGSSKNPYLEADRTNPLNVYGATKLAGEIAIAEETSRYYIIRTSWLFAETGNNFFTKMLNLLHSSTRLNVVNDQIGGPTNVGDLVRLIEKIVENIEDNNILPWGTYHYAGLPFVSWFEFASYINANLSVPTGCILHPVSSDAYPSKVKRPLNSCLDSSLINKLLEIESSDWRQAVRKILTQKEPL